MESLGSLKVEQMPLCPERPLSDMHGRMGVDGDESGEADEA